MTCLMCKIACYKEMPSSHFFITLATHDWLTMLNEYSLFVKIIDHCNVRLYIDDGITKLSSSEYHHANVCRLIA